METERPVMFLDFDGVINTFHGAGQKGLSFRRDTIGNLNYLLTEWNFKIIVSSSWTHIFNKDEIYGILLGAGVQIAKKDVDCLDHGGVERGRKIDEKWKELGKPTMIILDDDEPDGYHLDRWVKTNNYDGLTMSRAFEVDRVMRGEPKTRDALGRLLRVSTEE